MSFKIFKRDLKKIFTNSMAIILAVGVAVLPSLYAWINIYANWDPYGSTGNMQVAVIIEDEGYTYKDITINVGEEIEANLKGNKAIDWQFVDYEEGMNGVEASKYYAAILVPKNFSESLTSIMTPDFEQPKITYYANEKKNAIATKITDKVVQTVQAEVNESFVKTVVNVLEKLLGTVVVEVSDDKTGMFNTLATELDGAMDSVKAVRTTLDSFEEIMGVAKELNSSISNKNLNALLKDGNKAVNDTKDVIKLTRASVSSIVSSVDTVLVEASKDLSESAKTIKKAGSVSDEKAKEEISQALVSVNDLQNQLTTVISSLEAINGTVNIGALNDAIASLKSINSKLSNASSLMNKALNSNDISSYTQSIATTLEGISSSLTTVTNDYNKNVKPLLESSVNTLLEVLTDLSNVLNAIDSDVPMLKTLVSSLNGSLSAGDNMTTALATLLDNGEKDLNMLSNKLAALSESEVLNTIVNLVNRSQDDVGAFIACPVEIETDKVYSIDNYGSAMAPFYSTLAIWVGAVILVAILKTNVKNKKELGRIKPHQEFFGRGLTFILFSIVQALIICAGDLLFLGIQCYHPLMFMLAGVVAAFVFSFFIYSLVSAWGEIGKSIAVILLVLQLGGSGGTFPIDVTPALFRGIYDYLPFTYVINAMRECICGTYGADYWLDLLKLCAYIPISLIIGLFFRYIFKNPVRFFSKRIEETGIL